MILLYNPLHGWAYFSKNNVISNFVFLWLLLLLTLKLSWCIATTLIYVLFLACPRICLILFSENIKYRGLKQPSRIKILLWLLNDKVIFMNKKRKLCSNYTLLPCFFYNSFFSSLFSSPSFYYPLSLSSSSSVICHVIYPVNPEFITCFVNLTKARVIWEEELQLRKCLHITGM